MKKIVIGIVVALLTAVAFIYVNRSPKIEEMVVSPGEQSNLSSQDISMLEMKAGKGDCSAADRLGAYHSFFTLRYDDAVKWYRIAARCANVSSKVSLLLLLANAKDEPQVKLEIDKLIDEIKNLDAERAKEMQDFVNKKQADNGTAQGTGTGSEPTFGHELIANISFF